MNSTNKDFKANLSLPDLSFVDSLVNKYNLDQNAKEKLSLNLTRIWLGNNEVYNTPFAKNLSDSELFKRLNDEVFKPNASKLNQTLIDIENEQEKKAGPISIALPWNEWKETFLDTYDPKVSETNLKPINYNGTLRPLSISKASRKLRRSTSSSLPFMLRKGDVIERVVSDFDIDKAFRYPCVLYTRTQENKKIRGVWGYPIYTTLLEASYFYPVLEVRRNLIWRSSLVGPDSTSRNITRLIDKATKEGKVCLSIDIEKFDASTSPVISKMAFNNLATYFQDNERNVFNRIGQSFSNIEIVTPDGLLSGEHGVGSGSNFTNEIDSEIQMMIAIDSGVLTLNDLDVQGDDGAYILKEEQVYSFKRNFIKNGYTISDPKSFISPDYFVYLQKLYHKDYRDSNGIINGIYPIKRAINKARRQENWSQFEVYGISGQDFYSLRTISILENCRYHPLFEEFVKFVLKYDKYSLAFSKQGLSKYVRMMEETEGNRGDFSNQYGDNLRGIQNFETVKLIRKFSN